jgi:hypothetical protein
MSLLTVSGVQIDIGANLQPLKAGISQAEAELNKLGRSMSGAGSTGSGFGGLEKQTSGWGASLKGANAQLAFMAINAQAVVGAFTGVYKTASALADLGESAMRSEYAFEKLAGSAQEADRWVRAIQAGSMGTMTQGEAAGMRP